MLDPVCEISDNGITRYELNGRLHRLDGPAYVDKDHIEWFKHGELHRIGGPAVLCSTCGYEWWVDGQQHREDGPAVVRDDLSEYWFKGQRHREDGPAVIRKEERAWFYYGSRIDWIELKEKLIDPNYDPNPAEASMIEAHLNGEKLDG